MYLQRWHGWCHMKLLPSRRVLCTPYNHAPCQFMQSHIRNVHAWLAVTCHLHFWQNDRDLLRATAVTREWCVCVCVRACARARAGTRARVCLIDNNRFSQLRETTSAGVFSSDIPGILRPLMPSLKFNFTAQKPGPQFDDTVQRHRRCSTHADTGNKAQETS